MHAGHRQERTEVAKKIWLDTGPYVPSLFEKDRSQLTEEYGGVVKEEGVFAGILIPEYSPETAGVMPFERAAEMNAFHPELIPVAFLNPNYHGSPIEKQVETEWPLIGTWKAATWAIDLYGKHGFELMGNKDELQRKYCVIPERQVETSSVLGKRMM